MTGTLIGLMAAFSLTTPANAMPVFTTDGQMTPASLPIARDAVHMQLPSPPTKRRPESLGVGTTSRAAFVADVATGNVLYAKKPHEVMPIASLTKLMTAMVVSDANLKMDEPLTFTEGDMTTESKDVFAPGDTITREDALRALLIGSVNEAGNLLARTTMDRGAFIKKMNEKAASLRLASPTFVDPTGLSPGNKANAADVAAMLSIAMAYPALRDIASQPSVTVTTAAGKKIFVKSTNLLLGTFLNKSPYTVVGAKTGSLPEVGFNMAQITKNEKGHEVVAVELGSANHFSRYQDVKALTAWAFDVWEWK